MDFDRMDIPRNILVGSYIGNSHLRPALEICKILIERGYNVALVAPGNFTPSSEYPKIKQFSTGPKLDTRDLPNVYEEIFFEEYTFKKFKKQRKISNSEYLDRFKIYMEAATEFKPDLFFCDFLMNEACYDVAWKLKKPIVGISNGLTSRSDSPYRSDPSWGCHANMENEPFIERFRCAIIIPIMIIYESRSWVNELNEIRSKVGVSPVSSSIERVKDSLFFADTFFGFEVPHHLPPLIQEIGPVMQDEYQPITPQFSQFLSIHKRTMFVTLGTQVYTTQKNNEILLKSFIEAIDKNIIDGIIWSFSSSPNNEFPSDIILSNGTTFETSYILENKFPHIYITEFSPRFALLNQTNVKLFFSHGDSRSSHESIYTAKPMLLLPIAFDQMGNAEKLVNVGVALSVSKFNLSVYDILIKIEKLQIDENIQINVRRMQVLARINSKRKYRAADLIEFLNIDSHNIDNNNFNNFNGKNQIKVKNEQENYSNYANAYLRELITPDSRMGFVKGKYLDVFVKEE
ncbi:1283_t:CDS:2 [Diversispora eburnea]|uniref:1283_t:CDS:1 n=1 Tax=Diversispora eburnea TaxID=1213867 RepID=A0A9N9ADA5_9GLOM|nr:1283_t:CDS:2 [Diversispora eburnea]